MLHNNVPKRPKIFRTISSEVLKDLLAALTVVYDARRKRPPASLKGRAHFIARHKPEQTEGEMKIGKRTEITIETHRVLVIRHREELLEGWCKQCGARVKLVTPEIAAKITGLSRRNVYRLIETGQVHFTESPASSPDDWVSVCLKSLTTGAVTHGLPITNQNKEN